MFPFKLVKLTVTLYLVAIVDGLIEQHKQSISRRTALGTSFSIGLGIASFPHKTAGATTTPNESLSFSAYTVIPDDSANLDPRLEVVEPTNFLQSIANQGGSIWLGEHHNSKRDHQFQAEMVQRLYTERRKRRIQAPMAIGLEQVQSQFQPVLDAYVDGTISSEEMKQGVDWEKRWMWDFENYRPIFETAKKLKIKLLALNVDSEDLSEVEKGGYPKLPINRLRKYIKDP
jgi:hypothetical protein